MVKLTFSTDYSTSLKATADLGKAIDKVGDTMTSTAADAKRLEVAARRIVDQNLSPTEKYAQKMELLAKATKAGKLSMDQAEITAGRLKQRLDATTQSGSRMFGPEAIAKIKDYAGQFISLAGGIGLVSQAFREVEASADAAADRVQAALGSAGELAQVGLTPSASIIRSIRTRGIQPDKNLAQQLAFQLQSGGITGPAAEDILGLAEKGLISPENILPVATSARKFQRAFGTRSLEAVMDLAQQASKGTSANLAQTLAASLEFASGAKQLGIGQSEALAGLVVTEQELKDIGTSATAVGALFAAAQKKSIPSGGSIETLLANIQSQVGPGKTLFDVLGRQEAVTAFQKISGNLGGFREQRGLLDRADIANVATVAADTLARDPQFTTGLARRRAEAGEAVYTEERTAERENLMALVRSRRREGALRRGRESSTGFIEDKLFGIGDYFNLDAWLLRDALMGERSGLRNDLSAAEERTIADYLERIANSNEQMARESVTSPPRPSGRQEQ